jgi:hypothetical protein
MDVYSVTPDQEIGIPETARSVNVDYNTRSGFSFLPCKKKEWMDVPVHTFCQCILERRKNWNRDVYSRRLRIAIRSD